MSTVFLSYAHEDRGSAERLAHALESANWSVWWDRELVAGQNYREKIAKALEKAGCVVVIWSKAALESNWVKDEAEDAQRRNILVPVRFDRSVTPPLGFRSFQTLSLDAWLAAGSDPEDVSLQPLSKAVKRAIAGTGWVEQPSPTDPTPPIAIIEPEKPEDPEPPVPSRPGPTPRPDLIRPLRRRPLLGLMELVRAWRPRHLVTDKRGLCALLGLVFAVNYLETTFETALAWSPSWRAGVLESFRWFERHLDFEFHDLAGNFAAGGFSLSYFGLFPLLAGMVVVELYRKDSTTPFRVLSLSVGINYAVSLPFFVFLPIRERWADPASGAMLLSDRASSRFIELIRPFSGIDNCFPSFHTSLTVALVLLCFLYATRFPWCSLALGSTVVLSTFALGIHWLPDIIAGASLGVTSVCLARRLEPRFRARNLDPAFA